MISFKFLCKIDHKSDKQLPFIKFKQMNHNFYLELKKDTGKKARGHQKCITYDGVPLRC